MPPAPGSSPSLISGTPRRAASDATRRSHASASSSPPPSAAPSMAATDGLGCCSSRSRTSVKARTNRANPAAPSSPDELVDVGAGAERAPLAGHDERPHRGRRPRAAVRAASSAANVSVPMALSRSGRVSVTTAIVAPLDAQRRRRSIGVALATRSLTSRSVALDRSRHREPAAHRQRLAGDVAGTVAGEEHDRRCDVGRFADAAHRDRARECVAQVRAGLGDLRQQRGVGRARGSRSSPGCRSARPRGRASW